jgi:hypothetical protein
MKTFAILSFLLFLNVNTQEMNPKEMNNKDCFNIKNFNLLKAHIIENGSNILLQERLVAGTETVSKELSFDNKYIELVQHPNGDEIIIIDKSNKIPTYTCIIESDHLEMSAYASLIENDKSIQTRRNEWCKLITTFLAKE